MSMEITGIVGAGRPAARLAGEATGSSRPPDIEGRAPSSDVDIDQIAKDLQTISHALDRRLKFSINRELNRVVVKVIDKRTDKVIKELPSGEIQRLHVRIREAVGLLIDEVI